MKHTLNLFILTLGISAFAVASPTFCTGSLQSYLAPGASCSFDGFTIGDFTFVNAAVLTQSVSPANITVSATVDASGNPTVTFTPGSALQVSGLAGIEDYLFGFDLTSNTPGIGVNSIDLNATGSLSGTNVVSGLTTTGTVAEFDCYGGVIAGKNTILSLGSGGLACLTGGIAASANVGLALGTNVDANALIPFNSSVSSVDVLKEVALTTVLLGSASISEIDQAFTTTNSNATPEPGSMLLGGCGLLLVALGRLRKNNKNKKSNA